MPGICLVECVIYYGCTINTNEDFILLAEKCTVNYWQYMLNNGSCNGCLVILFFKLSLQKAQLTFLPISNGILSKL